jgi:RNA polymerase sigma factor (sigma-70 family)
MKLSIKIPRSQPAPHNVEGLAFDCELAERIRDGDQMALERLVERHMPGVNRYVHHRLGPGHDEQAWSVVRSTFDEALQKLGPYARKSTTTPMGYWLIRLAERNLGKQLSRTRKDRQDKIAFTSNNEEEDLAIVRSAMTALPQRYSSVLALALFEGMSTEAIAYTLGVGQARALRRLRAALKQIGTKLAPEQDEDEF